MIFYRKKFLKDLSKIPEKYRTRIEQFVFEEIHQIPSIAEHRKIEKMSGYPDYFKIRFGEYRVGLQINEDELTFERVLHRKEIYKYFP
ncbi:MAG: type II toxin-antitoxin system RelE/ParE family toxin [Calditrichaeota bacterium]|nr:type II toxin-antitoxin system RelE/ParE family toxin [Calditrichota bacterium]MCB0267825.1 type II toxin-antitoxin system RelE/ParE family toxin [Calditrichota bacterium]MCB0300128.1 type II toxin-antitoxin system RelE/ParE family toxin [Calditrichota bacterium]MCB9068229.1 type II toxin-antitoxin system RelE/ParE family toxin [Calditrichia bacterium]